jgi:hypothetical protein
MRNIRHKLVRFDSLSESAQARANDRYAKRLARVAGRVGYEHAVESALNAADCEVVFIDDQPVVMQRQGFEVDASKREVRPVRPGVVRTVRP